MFFHREHFFKSVQGQKIGDCQLQRGGVTEPGRDPEEPLRRSPRASLIREDTQCPRDPNEGRPPSSSTSTVPLAPHMGLETGPFWPSATSSADVPGHPRQEICCVHTLELTQLFEHVS